ANYVMQNALVGHRPLDFGHAVGGFPEFDGWPRWDSFTHQQYYEDWLLRAHKLGLKLIVTHPVNNEWMCTTLNHISSAEVALIVASVGNALFAAHAAALIPDPAIAATAEVTAFVSGLVASAVAAKVAASQFVTDPE